MESNRSKLMVKFIVPSVIGILLFMIPVKYNGDWTICVKILADFIGGAIGGVLPILCVIIVTISAVLSTIALAKPKFITEHRVGCSKRSGRNIYLAHLSWSGCRRR